MCLAKALCTLVAENNCVCSLRVAEHSCVDLVLCCALTPRCTISYSFILHTFCCVRNSLCVAHVLCIDTSGAIYRPPVCLHTTVKKAIIDCAASSANIQSGKHNILHIPSQPQMSICPSPKFSCYKSFRRCLKLDLGYGSPLPCTYTAAVL